MNKLKIGWASRDVSIEKPIHIPGQFYVRISKGVLDPVEVNALVIENGQDIVIFLSADLVVIRDCLLDEIREKVNAKNPQIPVLKIVMNATHTHTGPSHYSDERNNKAASLSAFDGQYDDAEVVSGNEYRNFLSTQACDAICEAYDKRTYGGVAYGYGYAVVAHSRRTVYFDDISKRPGEINDSGHGVNGHAKMYGDTNDDNFSHYEAGSDAFVNLLYTFDENEKLTGAIINVPCPSQNSEGEYLVSADYWHDVRCAIRKEYGDIFILPQCAAAGDLSPRILHYKKAQERRYRLKYEGEQIDGRVRGVEEIYNRKDIAERIANAFTEVYGWAKKDIQTNLPLEHIVDTVNLERRLITEEEYSDVVFQLEKLEEQQFITDGTLPEDKLRVNSILATRRKRLQGIIDRYESQKTEKTLPMELHVLRIGNIAFASNRFELYMDFQHRMQARSPFEQTFIIQLSGQPGTGGGTYLATERGAMDKGYSASMYCNLVSPQGGQTLVEETVSRLKQIYK